MWNLNVGVRHQHGHGDAAHARHFAGPDPFGPRRDALTTLVNALLATAFFRCWHLLIFFGAWSTMVAVLNVKGHQAVFQPTLLTVVGTVLGFVISYRTTSSFERYNEGRRLWSQVVSANRTFARTTWLNVPDPLPTSRFTAEEQSARHMIEKKSTINLLEAFAVSLKHYLRGEDGIYYQDLYHLVKHLPGYSMPAGRPSLVDIPSHVASVSAMSTGVVDPSATSSSQRYDNQLGVDPSTSDLPVPVTARQMANNSTTATVKKPGATTFLGSSRSDEKQGFSGGGGGGDDDRLEHDLLPAYMPPKYHLFDLFPFYFFLHRLSERGKSVKGKKAARLRAKQMSGHGPMGEGPGGGNLPLEISVYLGSYISIIQTRKQADVPTLNTLMGALGQLIDSLTGLERILTTPIPFSYHFHLWAVTMLYCLALPFQLWQPMKWLTVPATIVISFVFFGFLVAGEEIENPFGYDMNDLNLDHFTHNVIRNELKALTSLPPPDIAVWAFSVENDSLFSPADCDGVPQVQSVTPNDWVKKGPSEITKALRAA